MTIEKPVVEMHEGSIEVFIDGTGDERRCGDAEEVYRLAAQMAWNGSGGETKPF